jgi:TRAP-type C4-dicarboxylate transport system permease small subunit
VTSYLLGILKSVPRFCHFASCVPLFILVAITTMDVVARYALNTSVPDTAEISGMLLGICISLSLAYTTLKGEQVRFNLVLNLLPVRVRLAADVVTLFVAAVLFALIAWQSVKRVLYSMKGGEYIGAMEIPIWPAKSVFGFASLLTALAAVTLFVAALRRIGNRQA